MKRPHFALPEIYDDSLSYYDVLRKLIKSMHVINDNLNKIPEQIANEAKARLLGDQNLQQNINEEASARETADNELRELIHTSSGGVTEAQLNEEITVRQNADNALQTNIDNEETARTNADNALQEKINTNKNDISELKGELANKLPKSPANWEPWTAEEQEVARERMGLDKPFELIETITIDEESVNVVLRDAEPDGTPYNFESMMVRVTSFNTNMSGICRAVYAHKTDADKFDFNYSSITNSVSFNDFYMFCKKYNGIWIVYNIISHTNGVARECYAQPELLNQDRKTITGVKLVFIQSNFIVGTEIKIYGVRA